MEVAMKHWQDVVNVLVGIWLVISPWILGFNNESQAMVLAVALGVALLAAAAGALVLPRAWEEWSEALVGLVAIVSPWAIGMQSNIAFRNSAIIAGAIAVVMAGWTLVADKDLRVGGPRDIPVR
jgi:hypothetical protein